MARILLGHHQSAETKGLELDRFSEHVPRCITSRLQALSTYDLSSSSIPKFERLYQLVFIGCAALQAFLQSNVTGPPLPFSAHHLFGDLTVEHLRNQLLPSLAIDGASVYPLTPDVELFYLSSLIFNDPTTRELDVAAWRLHVNFLHQRMLTEPVSTLQTRIYEDLQSLSSRILSEASDDGEERARFLLERAAIHTYYGFDVKAREDLDLAANQSGFKFSLVGRLGKRTRFQEKETSQLVVLACSATDDKPSISRSDIISNEPSATTNQSPLTQGDHSGVSEQKLVEAGEQPSGVSTRLSDETRAVTESSVPKPSTVDLNDDTLLESISFSENPRASTSSTVQDELSLPTELASLDPGDQPLLKPLDSIILLSLASSITNTNPADGLTREETLPYALRVLEGGSSNWQIYTQALLVRSRVEAYRSRTVERGVLQLQALVDQVIAETTSENPSADQATLNSNNEATSAATFLPKPKASEAASVTERLRYIYQLCSPTRWELEAELAARWVSLGGLRTALEIYQRLQMWAEVSLCWAGLDREDQAKKVVRMQLFEQSKVEEEVEGCKGSPRSPPPPDAPRLYCVLGDLEEDLGWYEKAWEISGGRHARAQRSLGKHYFATGQFAQSANAYTKAIEINQLNHGSWYALGCAKLQLEDWDGSIEAFGRAVQIDEQDAESWSNLAAALLEKHAKSETEAVSSRERSILPDKDVDRSVSSKTTARSFRYRAEALKALKRAAVLKHDSWRIWENLLVVAASTVPLSYTDVVIASKRLIDLRGPSIGEKAVDAEMLDLLVRHVISVDKESANPTGFDASKPGLPRMVVELVDKSVVPLITSSRRLWLVVARLALWRQRPSTALEAYEKAWRAAIGTTGWETGTERMWDEIVEATMELVDAYESLGEVERTKGLGAGSGQVVARDWKFKARSAVRGIMGRGKEAWEDTAGWDRLKERMEDLKGGS